MSVRQVDAVDLGLEPRDDSFAGGNTEVGAVSLNCPNCGGSIGLTAPDHTERVACPHCAGMLDVSEGKLKYLTTLAAKKVHPVVPLGQQGTFAGDRYTLIGFMERYATYAGNTYPWTEYLLYNRDRGFRWLVHNENHWLYVEPDTVDSVDVRSETIDKNDGRFRIYDRGQAIVRYVVGEFPWKVQVGETVQTDDYIDPPHMLSVERTMTTTGVEMNVSLGTYMTTQEVEQAWALEDDSLKKPWGVAPCQPQPPFNWGVFAVWPAFMLLLFVLHMIFAMSRRGGTDILVLGIACLFVSLPPLATLYSRHAFEVSRWRDSDYSPYVSDDE